MDNAKKMADEIFALRQEVLAQCQLGKLPRGWKLELLSHEDGQPLHAVWYFPPGYGYAARGKKIHSDERLPMFVEVTLDVQARVVPIQHFRSVTV